jgi:uncharacterized OB-fold protein
MDRPLPVIDDSNRHYWEGARQHRLVMQRCVECRTWVHPPRPLCPGCRSQQLVPEELSGKGRVYSWSVMHSGGNPGFEDRIPYVVLVVELDEQKGLLTIGNIFDCATEDIEIDLPLEVTWEDVNDEITLPQWRPAGAAVTT